ncbi:hypothetical protein [Pseudolysinimonas sp.]|uniref:hypothetical protein n=1 Tax=Pseudolysinimonas sp. TaxID=2680009 RepID=UPI00286ADD12|nr:hypothetical protein [Pseudolysinimonas sp.]
MTTRDAPAIFAAAEIRMPTGPDDNNGVAAALRTRDLAGDGLLGRGDHGYSFSGWSHGAASPHGSSIPSTRLGALVARRTSFD